MRTIEICKEMYDIPLCCDPDGRQKHKRLRVVKRRHKKLAKLLRKQFRKEQDRHDRWTIKVKTDAYYECMSKAA